MELAEYLAGPACRDEIRRRTLVATVEDGRLVLEADDAPAHTRGLLAGAMAVAAETCEACGGKGDPIVLPGEVGAHYVSTIDDVLDLALSPAQQKNGSINGPGCRRYALDQ